MTPAEMREAAAVVVERAAAGPGGLTWLRSIAAAIRALPLPEDALTAREKLRRVREARELLATARVAVVPRGAGFVTDEATGQRLGDWRWGPEDAEVVTGRPYVVRSGRLVPYSGSLLSDARTWVLDTLRAEGWDVVEEGEG